MKKWFSVSNIMTFAIIAAAIYLQAPTILNNYRSEGTKIISGKVQVMNPVSQIDSIVFPPQIGQGMAIFWASWCAPCKLEMQRLKSSVENGKIPQNSIYAINPFESRSEVLKFISENKFPFIFIEAPAVVSQLKIKSTPTTIFIENGAITSMSSGLSLIGIWKAEFKL